MEIKKQEQVNLEKKRGLFFQLGLMISLSLAFIAFEWKTPEILSNLGDLKEPVEEWDLDYHPDVKIKPESQPEPEPAKKKPAVADFVVVDKKPVDTGDDPDPMPHDRVPENLIRVDVPDEVIVDDQLYLRPEVMPVFPGGERAMFEFIRDNFKVPKLAKEVNAGGLVFVSFTVTKTGEVAQVEVVRGDPLLHEEALRTIKKMPKWIPGSQGGLPVNVKYVLPINVELK